MKNLKCSNCNGDLSFDPQGRVIPCKECLETERGEGFTEGLDRGWEEGQHDYQKEIFRDIYKKGYEDCFMALKKEYAPDWVLRFAADDAQQGYKFEE